MTKWQLDRPGGPFDYPTFGFSAVDGAIIDGTLSNPELTTAPDAFWTEYLGASAETGVTRWGEFVHPPAPAEPTDGSMLLYDATANRWAPSTAAEVFANTEVDAALSATIAAYLGTEISPVATMTNPLGMTRWRDARAVASAERVCVVVEGDSIVAGAWADGTGSPISEADAVAWAGDGFVGKLRTRLADLYGDRGEGLITLATEEARWVFAGTNALAPIGVASTGRKWTGAGTATMATSPVCTGVDVLGVRRNGNVGGGQPLTGGGVAFLTVDGTDVTPNAVAGSGTAGVAAMTAGWTGQNGTLTYTTDGADNVLVHTSTDTSSLNAYTPLAGSGFAVTAGVDYLLTVEGKPIGFTAHSVRLTVRWYDAANAQISETPSAASTFGQIASDVWTPVTMRVTAPTGAVKAALFLQRTAGSAAGEVMHWKRVKMIPLDWHAPALGDGNVGNSVGTDANDFYRYSVDGLASTTHSIVLNAATGGTTGVTGIRCRNGVATLPGVEVHRAGRSGTVALEHTGSGYSTNTKTDLLTATYEAPASTPPALVVIALGANDWNRQDSSTIPPSTFKTHVTTLADRAVAEGASVLLIAGPRWEDDTKTYLQQEYADALREIAEASTHVAFWDLRTAWGGFADADASGFMYDSPHPNALGHNDYARLVATILGS